MNKKSTECGLSNPSILNEHDSGRAAKVRGICIFLIVIVFLVFGQTSRQGFFTVDDSDYVFDNYEVSRGVTLEGLTWAFTHTYAANWHPLTWISLMLDCQMYGSSVGRFHLTNVKIHAIAALLLFVALLQMTNALWRSAFVAVIFAIHPLRVESVSWISERKDVLSGMFFMLTLCAYAFYIRRDGSLLRYLGVVISMTLGLLSKPTVVTLPLLLLLLDYWPLRRFEIDPTIKWRSSHRLIILHLVLEKMPLLALSIGACIATVFAQTEAIAPLYALPISRRLCNATVSYVEYLGDMVFPTHLSIFYPYPAQGIPAWQVILSSIFLIFISITAFVVRKKYPYLLVGWLWFLGMLVPMIGLVQVGGASHADRYTYLSQIGICILVTWLAADICGRVWHGRLVLCTVAPLMILALATSAYIQTSYWVDGKTFWTHAITVTPMDSEALCLYGQKLDDQGRFDEAANTYEKVLEKFPYDAFANTLLARSFLRQGQTDKFLMCYETALTGNPESTSLRNAYAWILATSENSEVRDGERAIVIAKATEELYQEKHQNTENPLLLRTLAAAYAEAANFPEAINTAREGERICSTSKQPLFAEVDYATINLNIQNDIKCYKSGIPLRQTGF